MDDVIPVFYACDERFSKYTAVSLRSLADNADPARQYHVHILHTDITEDTRRELLTMQTPRITITFEDVSAYADALSGKLPIRDYYTRTTYFRLFIAEMFPAYDKAVYIDSDTVVLGDIAQLYDTALGERYVGAAHEQVMAQVDVYGRYVERVCGVDRDAYFNAGVLLINCAAFRRADLLRRFSQLLNTYDFVVTQDEDYLNVLCKDRVLWLDPAWNYETFGQPVCPEADIRIIHYIMAAKPWHYTDCPLGNRFWHYADKTPYAQALRAEQRAYTDRQKAEDHAAGQRLLQTALRETARKDSYLARVGAAGDRLAVLARIEALERQGIFDRDVEEDPPAPPLRPEDIDYLRRGVSAKIKAALAFAAAKGYLHRMTARGEFILRDILGLEHLSALQSGAILTCNHFSACDSFAMQMAYRASGQTRKLYRVIREGNYTGYPGFYGFLMRNCNTLPLSSDPHTMGIFLRAVERLLDDGHLVLIYPEQSMWWNYRKPKPLKDGAFQLAAMNRVPVLPCFITMRDSDTRGRDGFPVQEYTVHIHPPLYPEENRRTRENVAHLRKTNEAAWKDIYETTYGFPLKYHPEPTTEL